MTSKTADNIFEPPKKILVFGGTGTIGSATVNELLSRRYAVTCFIREKPNTDVSLTRGNVATSPRSCLPKDVEIRKGEVLNKDSIATDAFGSTKFDAVISCMASRTGIPIDAWAIDHDAHKNILDAAIEKNCPRFVLLSAMCVQKPRLAFQQAKLAFEKELRASGIHYSIVRPTAFFKSLSGQVDRVRRRKPFVLFGDGTMTSTKPISDRDLASFIVDCLTDPKKHNQVLPIGGPGPALTPRQQGEELFALLNRQPKFQHAPLFLLDSIIAVLSALGTVVPSMKNKAELARIGRYYATESMLLMDRAAGVYNATITPSTGSDTLIDYYKELIAANAKAELGDHQVF
ncbi:MAG: NAD(P)H-binding protein [Pseudomonadota bacterium]